MISRGYAVKFRFLALIALFSAGLLGAAKQPLNSPSGIRVDRGAPLAYLEAMDGRTRGTVVTLPRLRQTVFELQRAASTPLKWPELRAMASQAQASQALAQARRNTVPLVLLHSGYDHLDEGQVMRRGEVFAFAPLQARTHYGSDLHFSLETADILSHSAVTISELRLDAGDGRGFRLLEPGRDLAVTYASTGVKQLRLEAKLADGSTLQAISQLEVAQLATPDPTETWPVAASESWQGVAGTGQAYLYLADGHSELTRPVVVVEGFDIDNSLGWPELYELLNQENLLEDLRSLGYDAVVLDFTEAIDPIERNAFVLTELLQMVNAATSAETDSVLIGASMGGLVARYGLL